MSPNTTPIDAKASLSVLGTRSGPAPAAALSVFGFDMSRPDQRALFLDRRRMCRVVLSGTPLGSCYDGAAFSRKATECQGGCGLHRFGRSRRNTPRPVAEPVGELGSTACSVGRTRLGLAFAGCLSRRAA